MCALNMIRYHSQPLKFPNDPIHDKNLPQSMALEKKGELVTGERRNVKDYGLYRSEGGGKQRVLLG